MKGRVTTFLLVSMVKKDREFHPVSAKIKKTHAKELLVESDFHDPKNLFREECLTFKGSASVTNRTGSLCKHAYEVSSQEADFCFSEDALFGFQAVCSIPSAGSVNVEDQLKIDVTLMDFLGKQKLCKIESSDESTLLQYRESAKLTVSKLQKQKIDYFEMSWNCFGWSFATKKGETHHFSYEADQNIDEIMGSFSDLTSQIPEIPSFTELSVESVCGFCENGSSSPIQTIIKKYANWLVIGLSNMGTSLNSDSVVMSEDIKRVLERFVAFLEPIELSFVNIISQKSIDEPSRAQAIRFCDAFQKLKSASMQETILLGEVIRLIETDWQGICHVIYLRNSNKALIKQELDPVISHLRQSNPKVACVRYPPMFSSFLPFQIVRDWLGLNFTKNIGAKPPHSLHHGRLFDVLVSDQQLHVRRKPNHRPNERNLLLVSHKLPLSE